MLNKLRDIFLGRRMSVEHDLALAVLRAAKSIKESVDRLDGRATQEVVNRINGLAGMRDPSPAEMKARVRAGMPPKRMPTGGVVEPPVRRRECQADETCGFPLHLPPTLQGGPSYPPHMAVKISGDCTECLDCGSLWDTNDPEPPAICKPLDPMKHMHEAGWTDFPFARRPEVTSEPTDLGRLEQLIRKFFADVRIVGRVHDEVQYHFDTPLATRLVMDCFDWLHSTAFIPSDQGAQQELARIVAARLPSLDLGNAHSVSEFGDTMIAWCMRNPLD